MKNYIRNTINISCAKIVLPSVIENGPSPIIYTPKDNEPDETHYLWKVLEFSISKYVFFFCIVDSVQNNRRLTSTFVFKAGGVRRYRWFLKD